MKPLLEALEVLQRLALKVHEKGFVLEHLDIGGGLGVCYTNEVPPPPQEYVSTLAKASNGWPLVFAPGRAVVANTGVLLTKVLYVKKHGQQSMAIVDAGMNDLLRPALYGATHKIIPLKTTTTSTETTLVAGPVCESSDVFGTASLAVEEGDLLAIMDVGAYGFSMSSSYNTRPRLLKFWYIMTNLK